MSEYLERCTRSDGVMLEAMDSGCLAIAGPDQFRVVGGPCSGTRFHIERVDAAETVAAGRFERGRALPVGWRHLAGRWGRITDLETGTRMEVIVDSAKPHSHLDCEGARQALEGYLATEALATVVSRSNHIPALAHGDWLMLRTIRPNLTPPEPRVPVWCTDGPEGGPVHWTDSVDTIWRLVLGDSGARDRALRRAVASLQFALRWGGQSMALTAGLMHGYDHSLGRYPWCGRMDAVATINPDRRAKERARSSGVHRVPKVAVEIRSRAGHRRRIPAPMWLFGRGTLVVAGDYEPTVEAVGEVMQSSYGQGIKHECLRWASELLASSGERETHAELERKYARDIAREIGAHLDVEVTIKPKRRRP